MEHVHCGIIVLHILEPVSLHLFSRSRNKLFLFWQQPVAAHCVQFALLNHLLLACSLGYDTVDIRKKNCYGNGLVQRFCVVCIRLVCLFNSIHIHIEYVRVCVCISMLHWVRAHLFPCLLYILYVKKQVDAFRITTLHFQVHACVCMCVWVVASEACTKTSWFIWQWVNWCTIYISLVHEHFIDDAPFRIRRPQQFPLLRLLLRMS